jgi:rubrerythrin
MVRWQTGERRRAQGPAACVASGLLNIEQASDHLENFPVSIEAPRSGHWTIPEIPYGSIDRQRAQTDPYLLYLVAGASFVEITSDLYAANLMEYFTGDEPFARWLSERWEPEERQHGQALRRYVETVWPEFDWERAYQGFFAEYAPYCAVSKLGPTRALELASRCVVETGTATFYTTLARVSPDPVLRELANRIKNDEHRHYNMFLYHYRRLAQTEGTGPRAVLRTLRARMDELDQEDVYCAIKHVFLALHPDRPFTPAEYSGVRRHYARLARRHYPYRTAAQMLLRPLGLSPSVQSAAIPLFTLAGRLLLP